MYFIIEGSGSGKTTLLNIISGIVDMATGKILFENNEEKNIVHITQKESLIENLSIQKNIDFITKKKSKNKLDPNLIQKFNLQNISLQKKINKLSEGQKQRFSLMTHISLLEYSMLLLDEPTSFLDYKNSKLVLDYLAEQAKNKLIICVTHHQSLIEEYDATILEMEFGKIINVFEKGKLLLDDLNKEENYITKSKPSLNFLRYLSSTLLSLIESKFFSLMIFLTICLMLFFLVAPLMIFSPYVISNKHVENNDITEISIYQLKEYKNKFNQINNALIYRGKEFIDLVSRLEMDYEIYFNSVSVDNELNNLTLQANLVVSDSNEIQFGRDIENVEYEVLMDEYFYKNFFKATIFEEKEIKILNRNFKVVGVIKSRISEKIIDNPILLEYYLQEFTDKIIFKQNPFKNQSTTINFPDEYFREIGIVSNHNTNLDYPKNRNEIIITRSIAEKYNLQKNDFFSIDQKYRNYNFNLKNEINLFEILKEPLKIVDIIDTNEVYVLLNGEDYLLVQHYYNQYFNFKKIVIKDDNFNRMFENKNIDQFYFVEPQIRNYFELDIALKEMNTLFYSIGLLSLIGLFSVFWFIIKYYITKKTYIIGRMRILHYQKKEIKMLFYILCFKIWIITLAISIILSFMSIIILNSSFKKQSLSSNNVFYFNMNHLVFIVLLSLILVLGYAILSLRNILSKNIICNLKDRD